MWGWGADVRGRAVGEREALGRGRGSYYITVVGYCACALRRCLRENGCEGLTGKEAGDALPILPSFVLTVSLFRANDA